MIKESLQNTIKFIELTKKVDPSSHDQHQLILDRLLHQLKYVVYRMEMSEYVDI